MGKTSLVCSVIFLVLLSGTSYAGQENRPRARDETALNDAVATARVTLERVAQLLSEQNESFRNLLEEALNIRNEFKEIGLGASPEDAPRIVQQRNEVMKKLEQLVYRIREQQDRVNVLITDRANAQRRLDQLEGAKDRR